MIRIYDPEEIENIAPVQKEEIIDLYLNDKEISLRGLSEQFDCSVVTILKLIKEYKEKND